MKVTFEDGGALIEDIACFDTRTIFESGQNFRFAPTDDGKSYRGVAMNRPLQVSGDYGGAVRLTPCTPDDFAFIWKDYFDIGRDYGALVEDLCRRDAHLQSAACACGGLRLLRQDIFETVIAFILSANNNIARIRRIIGGICQKYGEAIDAPWGREYAFATPEALAAADAADIRALGAGYRDRYVVGASRMIAGGEVDLAALMALSEDEKRAGLMRLPGVGPKVADCILLFAMGEADAFPADTWIKRVSRDVYNADVRDLREKFSPAAGYAQQLLFHFHRSKMVKNGK